MLRRILPLLITLGLACIAKAGPWDMAALEKPPHAEFGPREGQVQEVFYEGEVFGGKQTRVFAYYARPDGPGPFPGIVLVHGGGGEAFKDWALHWSARGYAAIAMDLAGAGPGKEHRADGGPDQDDPIKIRPFAESEAHELWTFQAVAAVIRAHSLLASQPEVDPQRTGITGISWGGYLTCIVSGLDHRLKVAVPVYGCGFLAEDTTWTPTFTAMKPEDRDRWLKYFDPSSYLADVQCPILFINNPTDVYHLPSYRMSWARVKPEYAQICLKIGMPHGHIWTFGEVDRFIDWKLKDGPQPPRFGAITREGSDVRAPIEHLSGTEKGQLNFTTDTNGWRERKWQAIPAELKDGVVSVALPSPAPTAYYLSVVDDKGLSASTVWLSQNETAFPR